MESPNLDRARELVGASFNPSNSDAVSRIKEHIAQALAIMKDNSGESVFIDPATDELVGACMWAVKVVTDPKK